MTANLRKKFSEGSGGDTSVCCSRFLVRVVPFYTAPAKGCCWVRGTGATGDEKQHLHHTDAALRGRGYSNLAAGSIKSSFIALHHLISDERGPIERDMKDARWARSFQGLERKKKRRIAWA